MKNKFLNFFVVAGSGRNVGKTTFCCKIIEEFSNANRIIAVKISNHFHNLENHNLKYYHKSDDFIIAEELNQNGTKDTSRYLKSGADASFLIISKNEFLESALVKLNQLIDLYANLTIVESGAVLEIVKPGISAYITDSKDIKYISGYDFVICQKDNEFDIDWGKFSIHGNAWAF